jgi:hypothetical protein
MDGDAQHYNGSSVWLIPNGCLFYMGGLDPNASHTVTLTNTGGGQYFRLRGFVGELMVNRRHHATKRHHGVQSGHCARKQYFSSTHLPILFLVCSLFVQYRISS